MLYSFFNLIIVFLPSGWRRETVIRGVTKSGGIKGDVTYVAPDSSNKFKQMSDVTQVCLNVKLYAPLIDIHVNYSTWITKKVLN